MALELIGQMPVAPKAETVAWDVPRSRFWQIYLK